MILCGKKARLYNCLIEILNQHMDNYNYEFIIGKKDGNKYYTNNLENIEIHKKNSDDLVSDVEVISLGYNAIIICIYIPLEFALRLLRLKLR